MRVCIKNFTCMYISICTYIDIGIYAQLCTQTATPSQSFGGSSEVLRTALGDDEAGAAAVRGQRAAAAWQHVQGQGSLGHLIF